MRCELSLVHDSESCLRSEWHRLQEESLRGNEHSSFIKAGRGTSHAMERSQKGNKWADLAQVTLIAVVSMHVGTELRFFCRLENVGPGR